LLSSTPEYSRSYNTIVSFGFQHRFAKFNRPCSKRYGSASLLEPIDNFATKAIFLLGIVVLQGLLLAADARMRRPSG